MWEKRKNANFYEKYKPDEWLYIFIIVIFSAIRFIPVSSVSASFDDAVNDLSVGCVASTVVAWLIEIANCSSKNKERKEKERMVFAEYKSSVIDLCYFVSRRTINLAHNANARSFKQWLFILSDLTAYGIENNAYESRKRNYQHIVARAKKIKGTLIMLQNQYALLIQADIIDTDDFRQHMDLQIALCDDICDNLELNGFSNEGICIANDLLDNLVSNTDTFFPDTIPTVYSWTEAKG